MTRGKTRKDIRVKWTRKKRSIRWKTENAAPAKKTDSENINKLTR